MKKVLIYSLLLIAGLIGSQFLGNAPASVRTGLTLATYFALSFIMIHVGYEFELDKSNPRQYAWDYFVAFTAAAFPWIFCALYFIFMMAPPELWWHIDMWKESLLEARFASPTSAGVLFSMLAAAGLGATWVFRKARILAIFDDLDTILLMIPLQIMMVGFKPQLVVLIIVIGALLWLAWRYLNAISLPITWPWVFTYAAIITGLSETAYLTSGTHLEVLLPAFVLGCVMKTPKDQNPHIDDAVEGTEEGPETPTEQRVSTIVSAVFMVLVGLSMPAIGSRPSSADGAAPVAVVQTEKPLKYEGVTPAVFAAKHEYPSMGMMALHVLAITVLSNLGKMFPVFCYRRGANLRNRFALAIGMFPRGEVGAGVLIISLGYGIGGPSLTVAVLSLALDLLCTGAFILAVKKLIAKGPPGKIEDDDGASRLPEPEAKIGNLSDDQLQALIVTLSRQGSQESDEMRIAMKETERRMEIKYG